MAAKPKAKSGAPALHSSNTIKKVVLAYSGGLDTSYCVVWLKAQGHEVHTATIDTGGFSAEELARIEAHEFVLVEERLLVGAGAVDVFALPGNDGGPLQTRRRLITDVWEGDAGGRSDRSRVEVPPVGGRLRVLVVDGANVERMPTGEERIGAGHRRRRA